MHAQGKEWEKPSDTFRVDLFDLSAVVERCGMLWWVHDAYAMESPMSNGFDDGKTEMGKQNHLTVDICSLF